MRNKNFKHSDKSHNGNLKIQRGTLNLHKYPGYTGNDSRCNSSNTEAGVLVAITGHGPSLPEGGTYYHWRGKLDPHNYCTLVQEREPSHLSGYFSSTYSWYPRWEKI
ncbi:hypothetical protein AVEN_41022-1 [Araneus ventricosus]|uniref:Uncharacterized protein n=1 Tax=Araneus ventricosus TaxID=182803 RepID=A0A4Y2CIG4_ARAVE|nr:hypothetical protein AVEN_41022-1 [Araneus ventricosus]